MYYTDKHHKQDSLPYTHTLTHTEENKDANVEKHTLMIMFVDVMNGKKFKLCMSVCI